MDEGLVRELVHKVQNLRREKGFEIEDAVSVELEGSPRIVRLLEGAWGDYFKSEVLARDLKLNANGSSDGAEGMSVEGEKLRVRVEGLGKTGAV